MSRSWSAASGGPSVSTVTVPPSRSASWTPSSTAHSSCGLTVNPDIRVSTSCPSELTMTLPPTIGTRLTQTRISIGGQLRIRAFSGSNSGVEPTTATVTGYCSARYSTASRLPAVACAEGRYASSRCLPTDGPDPALVR